MRTPNTQCEICKKPLYRRPSDLARYKAVCCVGCRSELYKKRPLTQKQVNNLTEGTRVLITWSGGNGPHEYIIHKRKDDELSYVKEHNPNCGWWDGEITFVGKEKFNTQVSLL